MAAKLAVQCLRFVVGWSRSESLKTTAEFVAFLYPNFYVKYRFIIDAYIHISQICTTQVLKI